MPITSRRDLPQSLNLWELRDRYSASPRQARKYRDAAWLLLAGRSLREVQQRTGMSRDTSAKLKTRLIALLDSVGLDETPLTVCECGRARGHKGWCRPLFERSASRQAAFELIRTRRKG